MTLLPSKHDWMGFVAGCLALAVIAGCANQTTVEAPPFAEIEDQRQMDSPRLALALTAADPVWRRRAAVVVGRLQDPTLAAGLAAAALAEGDDEVLLAQLFALGQLGLARGAEPLPVAVAACSTRLAAEQPRVVAAAVEALGKLAPEGAADQLLPFLDHAAVAVRVEVAHALMRQRFVPVWRRQTTAPPPLPAAAVEGLAAALDDPSAEVRFAAAHALARYGEAAAAPALAAALGDVDERVRLFAVRGLGRTGEHDQAAALGTVLADSSVAVRREAVVASALLAAFGGLGSLRYDPAVQVRVELAQALGQGSAAAQLAILRELEQDGSESVQRAAIVSLARRLGSAYSSDLRGHLGSDSGLHRVAAARALQFASAAESEDQALAGLEIALGDSDPRVQAAAVESAAVIDGSGRWLEWALAADDLAVRGTAVNALGSPTLASALLERRVKLLEQAYEGSVGEAWVEVRELIVDTLSAVVASVVPKEGVPEELASSETAGSESEALLRRLAAEDPSASVRLAATVALRGLGAEVEPSSPPRIDPSPFLGTEFGASSPVVVLETSRGEIEISTLPQVAPIHVANFLDLVEKGYYDGLLWHRVAPNFVIQGGDPRGDGWGGPGYSLRDEISRERFTRGTVGMPKAGKDTGGGQIFITHLPTPHLDGNYTVFGRVSRGMEVVDRIEVGDAIVRARVVR